MGHWAGANLQPSKKKSAGLCGSVLFGKFCALNNVENESLQTFVYVCLSFEPYQL
jgi:hypothetical protein